MPVQDAMGNMARAMKDLGVRWTEVRSTWKDARAQEFEKKYVQIWERDFRSSLGQLEGMATYLGQMRRDCE